MCRLDIRPSRNLNTLQKRTAGGAPFRFAFLNMFVSADDTTEAKCRIEKAWKLRLGAASLWFLRVRLLILIEVEISGQRKALAAGITRLQNYLQ